jgi:hypothetical protein
MGIETPEHATNRPLVSVLVTVGTKTNEIAWLVSSALAFWNDVMFMESVPFDSAVVAFHVLSIPQLSIAT